MDPNNDSRKRHTGPTKARLDRLHPENPRTFVAAVVVILIIVVALFSGSGDGLLIS